MKCVRTVGLLIRNCLVFEARLISLPVQKLLGKRLFGMCLVSKATPSPGSGLVLFTSELSLTRLGPGLEPGAGLYIAVLVYSLVLVSI